MKNDWLNKQIKIYESSDSTKYGINLPFGEATRSTIQGDIDNWKVQELINILKVEDVIFDAGSNDGGLVQHLRKLKFNAFGSDLPKITLKARTKYPQVAQFLWSHNLNDEFPNKMFDVIYASSIIEHLYNDYGFLSRCFLQLKLNGRLILVFPDGINGHDAHLRYYDERNMRQLLGIFGFNILKVKKNDRNKNILIIAKKETNKKTGFENEDWVIRQSYEVSAWGNGANIDKTIPKLNNSEKFDVFPETDFKDKIILDVGSGPQSEIERIQARVKISLDPLFQDYDKNNWKIKQNNHVQIVGIGENLPFIQLYCDYVFCFNALSHTRDPMKTVREMKRVLADKGELWFYHNNADINMTFHLDLEIKDYLEMFEKEGMKIKWEEHKNVENSDYSFFILTK